MLPEIIESVSYVDKLAALGPTAIAIFFAMVILGILLHRDKSHREERVEWGLAYENRQKDLMTVIKDNNEAIYTQTQAMKELTVAIAGMK